MAKPPWPNLTIIEWLQTGIANLLQILGRESPSMLEVTIATWECIYGFILLLPWNVFSTAPYVYHWMRFAPQSVWGLVIFSLGCAQIMALSFDRQKSRRLAAQLSSGLWAAMYCGWLSSSINLLSETHRIGLFASPFGAWVFFWVSIAAVIQYKLAPVREHVMVSVEKIGDSRTVINVSQ